MLDHGLCLGLPEPVRRKLAGRPRCAVTISTRLACPEDPLTVLETDLEIALVVARNGPRLKQVMRQPAGLTKLPRKGLSAAVALQVVSSIRSRVVDCV